MVLWMATADVTITWDKVAMEHRFHSSLPYGGVTADCYYPTPLFVKKRVQLASELQVAGVAVWELGQSFAAMTNVF